MSLQDPDEDTTVYMHDAHGSKTTDDSSVQTDPISYK
jgi:hypothetical protein